MEKSKEKVLNIKHVLDVLSVFTIYFINGDMMSEKLGRSYGFCDFENKIIFIDIARQKRAIKGTIAHEIFHAYNYLNGVEDTEVLARQFEHNTMNKYKKLKGNKNDI